MDIQTQFKIWLNQQLDARGRGSKKALAEHLGVPSDAVSRMINMDAHKEVRAIHLNEMSKIFEFFDKRPPEIIAQAFGMDVELAKMIANADESDLAALRAFLQTLSASKHKQ